MIDKYQLLFQQLFANSSEAIIIFDLKGQIIDANPIAEKIMGESSTLMSTGNPWRFSDNLTPDGQPSQKAAITYFKMAMERGKIRFPWNTLNQYGEVSKVEILLSFMEINKEKLFLAQIEDNTVDFQNQKLLKTNQMVLEEISQGVSLPVILDTICREIENLVKDSICTIMYIDSDSKTSSLAAAPSISDELADFFNKLPIGNGYGSCGTAAFSGEEEFVANTFSDSRWHNIRDVAIQFGIKSCWSMPVIGNEGTPIGTIALSQLKEGMPGRFQQRY